MQTMLTVVTQNSRLPRRSALSRRPDGRSMISRRVAPLLSLLRFALDRAQVGPERIGSKGTNLTIRIGACTSAVSNRRLRRHAGAGRVRRAGRRNKVLVHLARRKGHRKAAGSPSRTCAGAGCLIVLLRMGQKVPSKAGLGAVSGRSAGTPASGGRYSSGSRNASSVFSPVQIKG